MDKIFLRRYYSRLELIGFYGMIALAYYGYPISGLVIALVITWFATGWQYYHNDK